MPPSLRVQQQNFYGTCSSGFSAENNRRFGAHEVSCVHTWNLEFMLLIRLWLVVFRWRSRMRLMGLTHVAITLLGMSKLAEITRLDPDVFKRKKIKGDVSLKPEMTQRYR